MREELLRIIAARRSPVPVTDETPLVQSGLLDSVALFNLMLWIEEQTGRPLDPTRLDIRTELNTVTSILRLVERLRRDTAPD